MSAMEIVRADAAALERLDPAAREAAVTQYLTDARDRLAVALQATGPEAVAAVKAEIATAAEASKQLGLSKEIQEDAKEMVRRAEYAVRKAVDVGQETGTVRTRDDNLVGNPRSTSTSTSAPVLSPRSFFSTEAEYRDANAMGALTEEQFEDVIIEARAEGNLSRPNIVAKAREITRGPARKPSRKPITDEFRGVALDLTRITGRVASLAEDDRFSKNADQIRQSYRSDLIRARDALQRVIDQLDHEGV